MPDVSPTKWHLAHVTWFFETFVLAPHLPGYAPFDAAFGYLFNSYYEGVGERHPRPDRGLLSRPPLAEVIAYRAHVDAAMGRLFGTLSDDAWAEPGELIEARAQPRAAASGIAADGHQARAVPQPAAPRLPAAQPARAGDGAGAGLDRERGRARPARGRRGRFCLRQREAAAPRRTRGFPSCRPCRHQRRVPRLRRGRRLPGSAVVARRRLGDRPGRGLGGAALLARDRRRVVGVHPGRRSPARRRRAGLPCQPLRGSRLRDLGRQAPADGGRMGGRRARGGGRQRQPAGRRIPPPRTGTAGPVRVR